MSDHTYNDSLICTNCGIGEEQGELNGYTTCQRYAERAGSEHQMSRKRFKTARFVSFVELSNDTDELMELLSQAESLNAQAETELKLRRQERQLIKTRLKKVRGELPELTITDHAVVRYLERVKGVDVREIKNEILSKLPPDIKKSDDPIIVSLNDSDDLRFVIRDNLIISVTPVRSTK